MIRTLRAFFLGRLLREKLLLISFVAGAALFWGMDTSARAGRLSRTVQATSAELKDQDFWIAARPQIETATQEAAAQMDPARTLDPTGLSVAVSQISNETGVNVSRGPVVHGASSGQFGINTMRLNIVGAEWGPFRAFYQKLQERAPYIAITELAIQPAPRNPAQVTGSMNVVSFEIKK
jgi:hypothetical protein